MVRTVQRVIMNRRAHETKKESLTRTALYNGDARAFKAEALDLDMWESGRLASWIRNAPPMRDPTQRACYYDLIKDAIQGSQSDAQGPKTTLKRPPIHPKMIT